MNHDEKAVEQTMSIDAVLSEDVPTPGMSAQDQAAVDALPLGSALLIVLHGPNAGARFLLDVDETTAGRSVTGDIFLDDVTVSREHAKFVRVGDAFVVRDAGSLNGTYVNHQSVSEQQLHGGDEVQIGKYRMTFYPSAAH